MANALFRYPKAKHIRKEDPPLYRSYKSFKRILRREFYRICVYCRKHDGLGGPSQFGVDHYKPVSHFPSLATQYANLFYACNECNSRKSDYWGGPRGTNLPNPCDHVMTDHLVFSGGAVKPCSKNGELAVELLDLNDDDLVGHRRDLVTVVNSLLESRRRVANTLKAADAFTESKSVKRLRTRLKQLDAALLRYGHR